MKKKTFIFSHANGYPPECYSKLLKTLNTLGDVQIIKLRPLLRDFTERESHYNWIDYAEDLILFIKKQNIKNIIAVGHSMGAIINLVASIKQPQLFEELIMIDPTILPRKYLFLTKVLPQWLKRKYIPVFKGAYNRRDTWPSKKMAFESYRKKRIFNRISNAELENYVESILIKSNNLFQLQFTKEWEEHCYKSVINPRPFLKKCLIPCLGIRGEYSELITKPILKEWISLQQNIEIKTIKNSGHLVPFEQPLELSKIILNHFKK